jgi:hypothetical protein
MTSPDDPVRHTTAARVEGRSTMSLQAAPSRTTLVQQLAHALEHVATDDRDVVVRRRAFMYAEAMDEADEADALFRFAPKLRACLAVLGLELSSRAGIVVPGTTRTLAA